MSEKKYRPETQALHAGHDPFLDRRARTVPIYQTAAFLFDDADQAADVFALKRTQHAYSRMSNPTTEVLEERLAALHGAAGAVATSSGMAAVFYAVATLASAGQNIVSGMSLYGGTHTLFEYTLKRFGIEVRFVDSTDPDNFARAVDENTRCLYTEAIGNPRCNVNDLEGIAAVARANGIPMVMDNTTAPPPIFNPLVVGCDLVVYSLTKIIGGHGTSIGGAVVDSGRFDWKGSGKFPDMVGPDPSYNGISIYDEACAEKFEAGRACPLFSLKLRTGLLRETGACPAPMNSFLFVQGLETLPLRAKAHCVNARAVAEFLRGREEVSWVNYSGLPGHPDYERAAKYFPMGPSAVFGFGVKGGLGAGKRFVEAVRLCSHLPNILDARTLVIHPATTTHSQMNPEEREAAGVPDDLIRISVGMEHIDDILEDLDQALKASQGDS